MRVDKVHKHRSTGQVVQLPVTVSGLDVVVGQGTVTIDGVDYVFDEDTDYRADLDPDFPTTICGWIALHNGSPVIFVDEVPKDGSSFSYEWVKGGPLWGLVVLFGVSSVPPGSTDLLDVPNDFIVHEYRKMTDEERRLADGK